MKKIGYYSDTPIELEITTQQGQLVDLKEVFIKVWLKSGGRYLLATHDPQGIMTRHCHVEGNMLVVDKPGRSLERGVIECMIEVGEDSRYYKDGRRNVFPLGFNKTDIEIV